MIAKEGEVPAQGSSEPEWTVARRQAHYKLRSDTSLRMLAALGGLSVIGTGDLAGSNVNGWWAAVVVTVLLVAGGCLAMSWSSFAHGELVLRTALSKDESVKEKAWTQGVWYDPRGELFYRTGSIVLALAGATLIVAFWWSAAA